MTAHHGVIKLDVLNDMRTKGFNVSKAFQKVQQLSGTLRVNMFFCFSGDMLEDVISIQAEISEFNREKDGLMYVHCDDWIHKGLMSFPVDKEDRPQRVFNDAIVDCDFVVFAINDTMGKYLKEEWELCKNRPTPQIFLGYKWTQFSKKTVNQRRDEMGVNDRIIDCVFSSPKEFAEKIIDKLRKIADNRSREINKIVLAEDRFVRLPKSLRESLLKKYSGDPLSESYISRIKSVGETGSSICKVSVTSKSKFME